VVLSATDEISGFGQISQCASINAVSERDRRAQRAGLSSCFVLKVEVANPTMIDAYRAGIPGNGKPFPDDSKIAKIEWKPKKMVESPFAVNVPATLQDVFLIEKDNKRFPDTKGWAYAVFDYQPESDTFTPDPTGTVNCGFACHTVVKDKDYIFRSHRKR